RITRITTWVRVRDRATGDTLRIYNAHWAHESQPSRARSAELLLERIAADSAVGDAVLGLGDVSADEQDPAFRRLAPRGPGAGDSYRTGYPDAGHAGTFNACRDDSAGAKVDAVLVGPRWEVLDAGIDRRRWGALWASDHYAVWAIVRRE